MLIRFLQGLRRDFRSSELVWLFVALTLSVVALSSVSFLADRMQRAFQFDARQLLAADLLLVGDQPIPERFIQEAKGRQLQIAQTIVFSSMATVGSQSKLASLKAVSPTYPLRGRLELAATSSDTVPPTGSVWVDPAMLASLNAKVGDRMALGDRSFAIAGILERELDRGAGFMNFAPRVMMSLEDLPSTGLIGLGSRVTYRLLVAGPDTAIAAYDAWASQWIAREGIRGVRIETLENAQPMMRKTLERAERFLSLVALLTAMVAAVAIALSARRYVLKQADVCAVMKCLGATQNTILLGQLKILMGLTLLASVIGATIGFAVQEVLIALLGNFVLANLPSISLWPLAWSILFSLFLLIGFAGPPLFSLVTIAPIRLVRKELGVVSIRSIWVALLGLLTCLTLIAVAAQDWKLAFWVGLSFSLAVALFALIAWLALRALQFVLSRWGSNSFALRFALGTQARRAGFAVMQITALGIALMALLMILLLRQDLLATWRGNIPVDAPNRFMINIQEDQKPGIAQVLESAGLSQPHFYPMVRARLIEVNGKEIHSSDYSEENARRLVDREFNLSYTDQLPDGNRITAGKWIEGDAPQISLEAGIAKTLHIKLGDQMGFELAGEKVTAPVTSLRKLDWGSMKVNFFVIMSPAQLSGMPQSWITSYYQSPAIDGIDFQLTQAYPNLTIVDVATSLRQIQDVLDRLSSVLGLLFAFTIAAAVLVLLAAIAATQDERFRSAALLKAVGASRNLLGKIAMTELLIIGILAGTLAGLAAGIAAWALGRFVLEIEFHAFAQSLVMGIIFGVGACLLAGYRFQRRIQTATAMECLREI
ncbi:ABC transporter permease [Polynucleobacter sp. AP-Nino-20-G2]|uniref:ABC transporter permease n=1 Tax=Polynucleobacter sp. AP-Nino-20-G2 TaxID=2576917 RepID=UPI001BFE8A71|nr:FtsX-like permease family protein [Polynucleobacter sp. AP-Nino-20-G2]QWE17380.1 FtsX-like permease family protein [Polynucleobacter sp. AP-Nino-20-G2]